MKLPEAAVEASCTDAVKLTADTSASCTGTQPLVEKLTKVESVTAGTAATSLRVSAADAVTGGKASLKMVEGSHAATAFVGTRLFGASKHDLLVLAV